MPISLKAVSHQFGLADQFSAHVPGQPQIDRVDAVRGLDRLPPLIAALLEVFAQLLDKLPVVGQGVPVVGQLVEGVSQGQGGDHLGYV